jgi:PelA/Pel-15E family pectate lyase
MHRAVTFYRTQAGYQGGYLWRYSADLTKHEGEGKAHHTSGWTQPPGTPTVGEAFLNSWLLTGDAVCLDAAREAAYALVRTQLRSGGWDSRFELDPAYRRGYAYRVDGNQAGRRNNTTLDDNKSQSALTLLMHVDEALRFKDANIHEAVEFALEKMLAAQYPNGAWPQQFSGPVDLAKHSVKKASYPEMWARDFPSQDYKSYYTLNDSNMSYIIDMLFETHRIYNREDCFRAAEKTGDFYLLAQMPDPQPGWAQQYDSDMHPAWARKFEPPAVTGGESRSVMRDLLKLYSYTGKKRFLEPLPSALAYYKSSVLPDGRLARFYELRTNKPLYFTKDYGLTYSDSDMPTHYSFKVSAHLRDIERAYRELLQATPENLKPKLQAGKRPNLSSTLAGRARSVIDSMDGRGAWVEAGKLRYHGDSDDTREIIQMSTFVRNLKVLAQFIGASN